MKKYNTALDFGEDSEKVQWKGTDFVAIVVVLLIVEKVVKTNTIYYFMLHKYCIRCNATSTLFRFFCRVWKGHWSTSFDQAAFLISSMVT